jgi:hypothetical protein
MNGRGIEMSRLLALTAVFCVTLTAACTAQPGADEEPTQGAAWSVKARYTDTCSCQATCPCFFGSPPTLGHCEGITLVGIETGHF